MSECKHDGNWRLQGTGGINILSVDVVCEKCGAKFRDVLVDKDSLLMMAAQDISTYLPCVRCPIEECESKRGKPTAPSTCAEMWRDRWNDDIVRA